MSLWPVTIDGESIIQINGKSRHDGVCAMLHLTIINKYYLIDFSIKKNMGISIVYLSLTRLEKLVCQFS